MKYKNYELAFSVYSKTTDMGMLPSFVSLSRLLDGFDPTFLYGSIFKRGFSSRVHNMNVSMFAIESVSYDFATLSPCFSSV